MDYLKENKLLMFSTGTSRVPYGGFATLESNRGNLSKFKIEPSEYKFHERNFMKEILLKHIRVLID